VGRAIPTRVVEGRQSTVDTAPLLAVDRLTSASFADVTFAVRPGEIVGIFGLVGSGRTELLESIVGLRPTRSGSLLIAGQPSRFRSPRDAARAGVVLVPEERQRQGLFFNLNIRHNIALPSAEANRVRVIRSSEREQTTAVLQRWRIGARAPEEAPDVLSGGNQQKLVAAKWLALNPRVLLLDEPTKGVDVGAKYDIHGIVRTMADAGAACLVVSSDLPELLALADRILVMREGRLRGEIAAADADEERVMRLAATSDDRTGRPPLGGPGHAA